MVQPSLDVPEGFIMGRRRGGRFILCGRPRWPVPRLDSRKNPQVRHLCGRPQPIRPEHNREYIKSWQETLRMEERFAYRKDVFLE